MLLLISVILFSHYVWASWFDQRYFGAPHLRSKVDLDQDVKSAIDRNIDDLVKPWIQSGISEELVNQTFYHFGSHVLFQFYQKKLMLYDPDGYCACNNSVYGGRNPFFISHLRQCISLVHLFRTLISLEPELDNLELVVSLDDIPMWLMDNNDIQQPETVFYPGFGATNCWSKPNFPIPFLSSSQPWDINSYESHVEQIWERRQRQRQIQHSHKKRSQVRGNTGRDHRIHKAVFRGNMYKGCSFERDTQVNFNFNGAFDASNQNCGRYLLSKIAHNNSQYIDYGLNPLTHWEQSFKYDYVLNVEGFGGWADRLFDFFQYGAVILHQSGPCNQWFEPFMKPYQNYIPIAHDFRDLVGKIIWAQHHPSELEHIRQQSHQFAQDYLSRSAILYYMGRLLNDYRALTDYDIVPRNGSVNPDYLFNQTLIQQKCG